MDTFNLADLLMESPGKALIRHEAYVHHRESPYRETLLDFDFRPLPDNGSVRPKNGDNGNGDIYWWWFYQGTQLENIRVLVTKTSDGGDRYEIYDFSSLGTPTLDSGYRSGPSDDDYDIERSLSKLFHDTDQQGIGAREEPEPEPEKPYDPWSDDAWNAGKKDWLDRSESYLAPIVLKFPPLEVTYDTTNTLNDTDPTTIQKWVVLAPIGSSSSKEKVLVITEFQNVVVVKEPSGYEKRYFLGDNSELAELNKHLDDYGLPPYEVLEDRSHEAYYEVGPDTDLSQDLEPEPEKPHDPWSDDAWDAGKKDWLDRSEALAEMLLETGGVWGSPFKEILISYDFERMVGGSYGHLIQVDGTEEWWWIYNGHPTLPVRVQTTYDPRDGTVHWMLYDFSDTGAPILKDQGWDDHQSLEQALSNAIPFSQTPSPQDTGGTRSATPPEPEKPHDPWSDDNWNRGKDNWLGRESIFESSHTDDPSANNEQALFYDVLIKAGFSYSQNKHTDDWFVWSYVKESLGHNKVDMRVEIARHKNKFEVRCYLDDWSGDRGQLRGKGHEFDTPQELETFLDTTRGQSPVKEPDPVVEPEPKKNDPWSDDAWDRGKKKWHKGEAIGPSPEIQRDVWDTMDDEEQFTILSNIYNDALLRDIQDELSDLEDWDNVGYDEMSPHLKQWAHWAKKWQHAKSLPSMAGQSGSTRINVAEWWATAHETEKRAVVRQAILNRDGTTYGLHHQVIDAWIKWNDWDDIPFVKDIKDEIEIIYRQQSGDPEPWHQIPTEPKTPELEKPHDPWSDDAWNAGKKDWLDRSEAIPPMNPRDYQEYADNAKQGWDGSIGVDPGSTGYHREWLIAIGISKDLVDTYDESEWDSLPNGIQKRLVDSYIEDSFQMFDMGQQDLPDIDWRGVGEDMEFTEQDPNARYAKLVRQLMTRKVPTLADVDTMIAGIEKGDSNATNAARILLGMGPEGSVDNSEEEPMGAPPGLPGMGGGLPGQPPDMDGMQMGPPDDIMPDGALPMDMADLKVAAADLIEGPLNMKCSDCGHREATIGDLCQVCYTLSHGAP